jgi:hypothetical protein
MFLHKLDGETDAAYEARVKQAQEFLLRSCGMTKEQAEAASSWPPAIEAAKSEEPREGEEPE